MKGYEAIAAMARGKCVADDVDTFSLMFGVLQYWDSRPRAWVPSSQQSMSFARLCSDEWEVVPDPSKPQEEEKFTTENLPEPIFAQCHYDYTLRLSAAIQNHVRKMIREELKKMNLQGLFGKYVVTKRNGDPVDPRAKYFVLRYDRYCKDDAARRALALYARESGNTKLSADLLTELCLEENKK